MYIKIKLEANNRRALESKHISMAKDSKFIHFPNAETMRDVKERIEDVVNIPADEQIIKSITEILQDHQKLSEVCDLESNEVSTLMLFDEDEEFICFLQLYNDEEAEKQRQFEEKSKNPSYFKNMPASSTSTVTLIEESDEENSSSEETDSSEESETSIDTNEDAGGTKENSRKRTLKEDHSVPAKKRLLTYHSDMISKYLDELPTYSERNITSTTPTNETGINIKVPEKTITTNAENIIESNNSECASSENNFASTSTESSATLKDTENGIATIGRKPCAMIAPEMRKFIAIVTTADYQEFLKTTSIEFECSNSTPNLQFDDKMPIVLHSDGNLWIACKNENTLNWVLNNLQSQSNLSCDIKKLLQPIEYRAYSVIIPKFRARPKNLYEQFQLLEHQNTNLNTEKWIVERKHIIENENDKFFERNVSLLCENEVIFLQVDLESEKYLKTMNFKLKYCFWKILFDVRKDA